MNEYNQRKDVVLVVDDSAESLAMINDALDAAGLTVLVALDGSQAINIANSITPDIILMDALMPGLDGFETCRQLKAQVHFSHIPIIFMTGLSDTDSIVKSFDVGSVDYIQKPVNSDELIARMNVHLKNARLTQSARSALDSAGQYLLTISKYGQLKWATPQAYQLFHSAGLNEDWITNQLEEHLRYFSSSTINKDKGVVISDGHSPIKVTYICENENQEFLLRLVNLNRPNEESILQAAFSLTQRESEVLVWLARGKSNSEIAIILDISPRTINTHLVQIFRKLEVDNRTSAAIFAIKEIEKAHTVT